MNRRRRHIAKRKRDERRREEAQWLAEIAEIEKTLREFHDAPNPDWEEGTQPKIYIRPPARLRKRTNVLIGRVYNRVYY
jgi:hypothetical protein